MRLSGWIPALLLFAVALSGCGGGGTGGGGVDASLNLFLTDSFRDDYDHVWVTIHKVELRNASTGVYATGFESPSGSLVDAKRLRDVAGERFSLLANGSFPQGTYDSVRVTFKDEVILVPTGSMTAETRTFAPSVPRDAQNRPMVNYTVSPSITVPSSSGRTVIDLDLAQFAIDGNGQIIPFLKRGSDNGIDDISRHEREDYKGTISGLTSTAFTLNMTTGAPLRVTFNGNTEIYRESTGQPASLANGQLVEVDGRWDSSTNSVLALQVKIEDGSSSGLAEAKGGVSAVDLNGNRMILTDIFGVENFVPQGPNVNVEWTDTTVFRRSGEIVNESFLQFFPFAEVKGTYNPASNTITATRITLEDERGPGAGEAECKGDISNPNTVENRMVLNNIREVEGFTPQGNSVNVTWVDGQTVFRRRGDIVDESQVLVWPTAEVKGTYDPGTNTIAATRITLDDD